MDNRYIFMTIAGAYNLSFYKMTYRDNMTPLDMLRQVQEQIVIPYIMRRQNYRYTFFERYVPDYSRMNLAEIVHIVDMDAIGFCIVNEFSKYVFYLLHKSVYPSFAEPV